MYCRFLLALLVWACLLPAGASAQNYLFSVPEFKMQVYIQQNASVRVEYEIVFENGPRSRPLDAVDVGLFHKDYNVQNMRAFLNDQPVMAISRSPYVDPGVEVKLGRHAIPPGQRGVFRFSATMPDMVYQDTTRNDYASVRVTPTWFNDPFVSGTTQLQIAVHLPAGVDPDDVLYQTVPFTEKVLYQDTVVAVWVSPQTRITAPHLVGLSFPKDVMHRVVTMSKWEMLAGWWENAVLVRLITGIITLIVFSILFFVLTGGTGWSVFVVIIGLTGWLFYSQPAIHLVSIPFSILLFGFMFYATKKAKKKKSYLPPITSVEGGGIRRGLTAPEAAILLEMPLGKVVTLVIFGLLKKGVIRMTNDQPLSVAIEKDFVGTQQHRLRTAAERNIVLHVYEHHFITSIAKYALQAARSRPKEDKTESIHKESVDLAIADLNPAIQSLIKHTASRLEGYDLPKTSRYYKHQINRAWEKAEKLGEVELRNREIDKSLEWMMLQDNYQESFGRWENRGYRYTPIWIRAHRGRGIGHTGGILGGAASPSIGSAGAGGSFSPSFRDVAGSFAGWTENLAGQAASAVLPSSGSSKGSVLDLSGFDKVTADVFQALGESGEVGSGSGGGGCACAGCACACACAGGGR